MNTNVLYLLLYIVCVNCEYEIPIQESEEVEVTTEGRAMNSVIYQTVHKYYCSLESATPSQLIIYGTKSWTFPPQNVNLTLSYPTTDASINKLEQDYEDHYIITGFSVVLFTDSKGSRGFITDGDILQDSISLTFLSSNASALSYEFWLYGVTRRTHGFDWNTLNDNNMCT